MAVHFHLEIEGVEGEGPAAQGKPRPIQLLDWNWEMTQSATTHHGSGGGSGQASVGDLHVDKVIDRSSPTLMKMCCTGQHLKKAVLVCRKAAGDKGPLDYLTITMEDVIISSVRTGGTQQDERIRESVSLNFARYRVVYVEQSNLGGAKSNVEAAYDVAAAVIPKS